MRLSHTMFAASSQTTRRKRLTSTHRASNRVARACLCLLVYSAALAVDELWMNNSHSLHNGDIHFLPFLPRSSLSNPSVLLLLLLLLCARAVCMCFCCCAGASCSSCGRAAFSRRFASARPATLRGGRMQSFWTATGCLQAAAAASRASTRRMPARPFLNPSSR